MKYSALCLAAAAAATAACKTNAGPGEQQREQAEEQVQLAGVWPQQFKCDSIAAPAALEALLGAPVRQLESAISSQRGIAPPCMYELTLATGTETWQFDFDCRADYLATYDALVKQYRTQNTDMIADWNHKADGGMFKPNDAGIQYNRPGDPVELEIGKRALDHHGTAVIFIDDDAPCYVRVAGKDTARRHELAKLVAKNLTLMNAPMTPRRPDAAK